jgi:hypothetical protein
LVHTELRHNFCAETARQTSQELNKILQEAQWTRQLSGQRYKFFRRAAPRLWLRTNMFWHACLKFQYLLISTWTLRYCRNQVYTLCLDLHVRMFRSSCEIVFFLHFNVPKPFSMDSCSTCFLLRSTLCLSFDAYVICRRNFSWPIEICKRNSTMRNNDLNAMWYDDIKY